MLFNSFEFAIFLPVVFFLYWFVTNRNLKLQNALILVASYVFYGWWDWRFLFLVAFSTLVDFTIGYHLPNANTKVRRKMLLWLSLGVNLGLLGVFKYYNFFLDSLYHAAPGLKVALGFNTLDVILPVGISFYTFQTLSYTIDIYRGKLEPAKNLIAFASFVSFFPQLVAGPIERATNLLPQFQRERKFEYAKAVDGMRQILWGLFKKVVIADNCAVFVNDIFANYQEYSGSTLLLGAVFFAFQIYGDFSGYSDIAIGVSRLFGFNLMQNFAFPYFSRDIAEFWRRWHISLSTWFRDYLYIPLGGSKGSKWMQVRNVFIIFLVSGFWHGANWTFIIWGALNAVYFLPLLLIGKNRQNLDVVAQGRFLPNWKEMLQMGTTFLLTTLAWVFFRAESVSMAMDYLTIIASSSLLNPVHFLAMGKLQRVIILIALFIYVEWKDRNSKHGFQTIGIKWLPWKRYALYYIMIIVLIYYQGQVQEFIYFQF